MSIRIRRWKCALLLKLSLVFLLESVVWHSSSDNNCSRFGATAATATIRTTATSMSGFDKEMDHSTRSLASESWEKELNTNNKEATKEDEEMFETWLEDVEAAQATSEPSPASANNFGQWLTDVETFQQQTPEPTPAPNTEKPTRLPTTKRPTTQKPTFPPQSEDTPTGGIPSFFPPFDNVPFSTFEPVPTPTAPRPVAPQRVPTSRPQRAPTNQPQRVPTNQPQRAPTSRPQPLPTEAPIEPTQTPVAPAPVSKAPVTQAPVTQTPITPAPAVVNVTGAPIAVTGAPVAIPTTLPPNVTAAPASVPPGVLVDETVTGISIEYKNVSNLSEDDLVQLVLVTETWFNEYWGSRENNRRSRRLQENATVIRGMNTTMIIVSQNSTASPNNNVVSFSQQLRYELVGGQDKPTAESLIVSTFEDKSANTDYHRRLQATILPAFANVASPIPLPLLTSIPAPTAPTPAAPTAPTPVAPSAPEVPTDDDDGLSVGALIVIIAAAIVGVGVGAYALFSRTKGAPLADASRPDAASSLIGGGDGMSVVSRVSGTQAKAQQRPSALDVSTLSQNPTVLSANLSGKAQLVPLDDDDDIDIEGASGYNDTDELNSYAGKRYVLKVSHSMHVVKKDRRARLHN